MKKPYTLQSYIDALDECRTTINWMLDNMSVDNKNLQSDAFNIPANTLDRIDRLAPKVKTPEELQADIDDMPF